MRLLNQSANYQSIICEASETFNKFSVNKAFFFFFLNQDHETENKSSSYKVFSESVRILKGWNNPSIDFFFKSESVRIPIQFPTVLLFPGWNWLWNHLWWNKSALFSQFVKLLKLSTHLKVLMCLPILLGFWNSETVNKFKGTDVSSKSVRILKQSNSPQI